MLKYALIKNNIVENIINCENSSLINSIKDNYQHIEFVGDNNNQKDICVGDIWNGSTFSRSTETKNQINKHIEMMDIFSQNSEQLLDLLQKQEDQLTEEEKTFKYRYINYQQI